MSEKISAVICTFNEVNPLASNMVLVLGAVAFGSASHPSFTIARIRVDVLPNQV